jgi:quercetin dioxygenase-like cupin family protein
MSQSKAVQHVRWQEVPAENMNPLFDRQYVVGDQVMVARISMKRGCLVPQHSHRHEQISHVLSGVLRFTVDGKEITLGAGELLLIPPHVLHAAEALEDTVAIDTFTPPREDWIDKTDQYLRAS